MKILAQTLVALCLTLFFVFAVGTAQAFQMQWFGQSAFKVTKDPKHAAYAVRNLLKTKMVMPIHYGTFKPLKGTPEEFAKALGDFPTKVVMQPGDTKEF